MFLLIDCFLGHVWISIFFGRWLSYLMQKYFKKYKQIPSHCKHMLFREICASGTLHVFSFENGVFQYFESAELYFWFLESGTLAFGNYFEFWNFRTLELWNFGTYNIESNKSVINRLLVVSASWLMAQGPWLMPQGPLPKAKKKSR